MPDTVRAAAVVVPVNVGPAVSAFGATAVAILSNSVLTSVPCPNLAALPVTKEYNSEKDVCFYDSPVAFTSLVMQAGNFAILYPQDYHRPGLHLTEPAEVRNMVIKIHNGILANY